MQRQKILLIALASSVMIFIIAVVAVRPDRPYQNILDNFTEIARFVQHKFREYRSSDMPFPSFVAPNQNGFLRQEASALYESRVAYEEAIIKAIDQSIPGVVSIVATRDVPILERCPAVDPFFGPGMRFYVPCDLGRTERQEIGGGTGFFVSSDGLILTNRHVVADARAAYTVFLGEDQYFDAKIIGLDEVEDLALLKIEGNNFPVLSLGNSDAVRLGQTAIAIGNALGEYKDTVSVGVISGLDRTITATDQFGNTKQIEAVLQTDAAINPGNSGGPLINLRGEVIGINTAMAHRAENIGFAIPVNRARRVIDTYKETGRISASFLGIWYESTDEGAKISAREGESIAPDSPASRAGLRAGDIIIEASGRAINRSRTLASVLSEFSPGDTLAMRVRRGEETLTVRVTLAERPIR